VLKLLINILVNLPEIITLKLLTLKVDYKTKTSSSQEIAQNNSEFSPKFLKSTQIIPLKKKTNVLIPSDALIQSKVCEILKLDEDQLLNREINVGVESRKISKIFKRYTHKYRKEIASLKDDLKQRKKESLLEFYNPRLK